MIEKLDIKNGGVEDLLNCIKKINEVIDAVNDMQTKVNKLAQNINFAQLEVKENVQDMFAEQRKWIGKLCRFWNFKDGSVDIGILKAVDNLKPTIPYINDIDCSYAYCEPVNPDDDIIYKGSDNE